MLASSDFVSLCRFQVNLLTQGLGADFAVVYLTEEFAEDTPPKLIPIVAYPEMPVDWEEERLAIAPKTGSQDILPYPKSSLNPPVEKLGKSESESLDNAREQVFFNSPIPPHSTVGDRDRLVLPLIGESVVMGLLVTSRQDRMWNQQERDRLNEIANTLAIACILDRRSQWLQQQEQKSKLLQTQQHDVLDNLLHQVRSPLTALRTFGKLLLKRILPGDVNRKVAESILRESDRLQELLQKVDAAIDIVDIKPESAIEEVADAVPSENPVALLPVANSLGNEDLKLESCSITEVLEPLLASAEAIAQEGQLSLQVEILPNLPLVRADVKALREVTSNLIDNALKYTHKGGKVYVRVGDRWQTNKLFIAISDNGPGIPPQDLKHIFERHYRGVQAETGISGTGLGLAIAKQLIEQMDGEIQVFSPAIYPAASDRGTTFFVWLPAC